MCLFIFCFLGVRFYSSYLMCSVLIEISWGSLLTILGTPSFSDPAVTIVHLSSLGDPVSPDRGGSGGICVSLNIYRRVRFRQQWRETFLSRLSCLGHSTPVVRLILESTAPEGSSYIRGSSPSTMCVWGGHVREGVLVTLLVVIDHIRCP